MRVSDRNPFAASAASDSNAEFESSARPVYIPFERGRNWLREADLLLFRSSGLIACAGRGAHWHAATVSRWGSDWFALECRPSGGRAVPVSALVERFPRRIDVFSPNADGRWPEYRPDRAVAWARRATGLRYGWGSVLKSALARLPFVRYWLRDRYFDDAARDLGDFPFDDDFDSSFDGAGDFDVDFDGSGVESDERGELGATDAVLLDDPNRGASRRDEPPKLRLYPPKSFFASAPLDDVWARFRPKSRGDALQCAECRALADRFAGVDPVPFLNDRFVEPADLARSPFYRYRFTFDRR